MTAIPICEFPEIVWLYLDGQQWGPDLYAHRPCPICMEPIADFEHGSVVVTVKDTTDALKIDVHTHCAQGNDEELEFLTKILEQRYLLDD